MSVEESDNPADLEAFVARYPDSVFVPLARARIEVLRGEIVGDDTAGEAEMRDRLAALEAALEAVGDAGSGTTRDQWQGSWSAALSLGRNRWARPSKPECPGTICAMLLCRLRRHLGHGRFGPLQCLGQLRRRDDGRERDHAARRHEQAMVHGRDVEGAEQRAVLALHR